MKSGDPSEIAVLAGYCIVRLSFTELKRKARPLLQLALWDRDAERLEWAVKVLNRHLPRGRQGHPVKISWQEGRGQGAIHITGSRARKLLELIAPYVVETPLADRVAEYR